MCGICGIYRTDGAAVDPSITRDMASVIVHRGPDEDGFFDSGNFSMGMRRLSIIDTTGGSQPIKNETGSVVTIQNGELYNFQELSAELAGRGHSFSCRSDTEVIVHMYEDHGPEFIRRIRGMFGIAVWDVNKKELYLYRDRLGIKPLYIYEDGPVVAFASEIKSLMRIPGFSKEISSEALELYFTYGYIPGPTSIFSKVRKLPPGHMLRVGAGGVREERYWEINYATTGPRSEGEALEALDAILRETVRGHLISDVPLGVFLSGGVDSSTLVAYMRELGVNPIKSYSVGFDEKSYSELEYAGQIAKKFDTEHHELVVGEGHMDVLPTMVRHFDEPFADSSAVPMFLISRFARQGVTVALSGEGGDETFAGYHTYAATRMAALARRFPLSIGTRMLRAVAPLLPTSYEKVSLDYKIKKFVQNIATDPAESHMRWKMILSEEERRRLMANAKRSAATPLFDEMMAAVLGRRGTVDVLSLVLWLDTITFLPDDLLVKNDRMSMANSLEARVPFLDHVLVEFVSSLPPNLKMKGLNKKYILKKLMEDRLGKDITYRKKAGFNIPLPKWLLNDSSGRFRNIFDQQLAELDFPLDRKFITGLFDEHRGGKKDNSRALWTLLNFVLWHNHYISGKDIG